MQVFGGESAVRVFWFPDKTVADDVLPFRNGPLRLRMRIEYSQYKRFGSETKVTFEEKD